MSFDRATRLNQLAKPVRARIHRLVGIWHIDRAERAQLRGLLDLWSGSGRPLILAAVLMGLTLLLDRALPDGMLGAHTPGPEVSQAVLELFGAVLALLGLATLAAAVSLAVVQSAAGRYRRYVVDQLADDPARDAFLSLLFIGFTVTLCQLALVTAGVLRPSLGLLAPLLAAIAAFGLLTQYVRQRIRWLKPSEIVRHLALDVSRHQESMLTPATALIAGPTLSRQHREATRDLLRLLSLALDGLAEGEPATIDDAVAAYRAYTDVVARHARTRLRTKGLLAAVLTPRSPSDPGRFLYLRDERLMKALLADSRSRSGPGRPGTANEDAALWFEQLAAAAAPAPLLAVLLNGRGRDDEFAEDWCELLPTWFASTREDGDLVMGLTVLSMLNALASTLNILAKEATAAPMLPASALDACTEVAGAGKRMTNDQLQDWGVRVELRDNFLSQARVTYLELLKLTTTEVQEQQRVLARRSRSRLYSLGWLTPAKADD